MRGRQSVALLLAAIAGSCFASGNTLPRPTASALGMADANVALATGPSAQFINPANIAVPEVKTPEWEAGSLLAQAKSQLTRSTAAGATTAGEYNAKTTYPLVPYAAFASRYSERTTVGMSVESPHGLGNEWRDHSFDLNLGPFGTADLAKKAELKVIRIGPALGLRIDDSAGVGIRAFAQHVEALEENDISTVKGKGTSLGAQLGVRYAHPDFILAAAYTTPTDTRIKGTLSGIHPVAAGSLMAGDARANILLPGRLQTGFALHIASAVWWELDLDRIGWSYMDELTIRQSDGTIANAGKNQRHNKDTLSVRTAIKWHYSPTMDFYTGVGYDPTPVAEEDATPTSTLVRKLRFGIGATRLLDKETRLDFAYQYIRGLPRTINESTQDNFGGVDTNLFEGTYQTRTHVLGLGVTANF